MPGTWPRLSRCRLLAVVLALGAAQTIVRADVNRWSSIGPEARTIHSIAVHPTLPDTIYAGAVGAIFKTEDAGRNWRKSDTPILTVGVEVRSIVFDPADPSIVYAAALGVAKSTDAGATWVAMNSGLTAGPYTDPAVYSLVIDPHDRGTLYAGTFRGEVFRTTNGGTTWELRKNGLPSFTSGDNGVRALAIDPDHPSTIYAGLQGTGVYKTVDAGLSWTTANVGLDNFGVVELAIDPQSPNRLFAGTLGGGLYRSLDAGGAWSRVLAPSAYAVPEITVPELEVDPFSPDVVYAGTSTGGLGIFRSSDGGQTWTRFNDGLPAEPDFRGLAIAPSSPTHVYGGLFSFGVYAITLTEPCAASADTLCLNDGRFRVRVNWKAVSLGTRGVGRAVPLTGDTGYFWFFSDNNVELVVKVVDGRAFNGRIWVFYGALSDVEYTIAVTDSRTGAVRTYANPQGRLASIADTAAFVINDAGNEIVTRSDPVPRRIAACSADPTALCLNANRFLVRVVWRAPNIGAAGSGQAVGLTSDTGYFWFFSSNNVELLVKVVDGRPFNGHFWVFYGALSDVEYTITVTDTETGAERTYFNPSGQLASVADAAAF